MDITLKSIDKYLFLHGENLLSMDFIRISMEDVFLGEIYHDKKKFAASECANFFY